MGMNKNIKVWEAVNHKYMDEILKRKKLQLDPHSLATFQRARHGQGFVGIVDGKDKKIFLRLCFHENDGVLRIDKEGRPYKEGEYLVTTSQRGGGRVRLVAAHKMAVIDMLDEGEHAYEYYTEEERAKRKTRTTAEQQIADGRFFGFGVWKGGDASLVISPEVDCEPKAYCPNEYTLIRLSAGSFNLYYSNFSLSRKNVRETEMYCRLVEVGEEFRAKIDEILNNQEYDDTYKHLLLEKKILAHCENHVNQFEGRIKHMKFVSTSLNTNAFVYDRLAVLYTMLEAQFHFQHGQGVLREVPSEVANILKDVLSQRGLVEKEDIIDGMQTWHWEHIQRIEDIINGDPVLRRGYPIIERFCMFALGDDAVNDAHAFVRDYFDLIRKGELHQSIVDSKTRSRHKELFKKYPATHALCAFIEYNFKLHEGGRGSFIEHALKAVDEYYVEKPVWSLFSSFFKSEEKGLALDAYKDIVLHIIASSPFIHILHGNMDEELFAYLSKQSTIPFRLGVEFKSVSEDICYGNLIAYAAKQGCSKSLELLLSRAQDKLDDVEFSLLINQRCSESKFALDTPLYFAASKGHADCARLLIEYGADINIENVRGRKVVDLLPKEDQPGFNQLVTELQTMKQSQASHTKMFSRLPEKDSQGSADNANVAGPDPGRHAKKS